MLKLSGNQLFSQRCHYLGDMTNNPAMFCLPMVQSCVEWVIQFMEIPKSEKLSLKHLTNIQSGSRNYSRKLKQQTKIEKG